MSIFTRPTSGRSGSKSVKKLASRLGLLAVLGLPSVATAQPVCDPLGQQDPIQSSYHSTMAKTAKGDFYVWGESMAGTTTGGTSGTHDLYTPTKMVTGTSGFTFTGTPRLGTVSSFGSTSEAFYILTTDANPANSNLYAWGDIAAQTVGVAIPLSKFAGTTMAQVALPAGVAAANVKMMDASRYGLLLLTTTNDVWVLSSYTDGSPLGDGSATNDENWHRVKINSSTFLTNVADVRICNGNFLAVTTSNVFYTWGPQTYNGDGSTAVSLRNYATPMTSPLPGGVLPRQIDVSGTLGTGTSYYVLGSNGILYTLGENTSGQLGNGTATAQLSWVVAGSSVPGLSGNISRISSNNHSSQYPAAAVVTSTGKLYLWGNNSMSMLGLTGATVTTPTMPTCGSPAATDVVTVVEVGGHTSVYVKTGSDRYCYVGHKVNGSMGDGTNLNTTETCANCDNTGAVPPIPCATAADYGDAPASYDGVFGQAAYHYYANYYLNDLNQKLYIGGPQDYETGPQPVVYGATSNTPAGDGTDEDGISVFTMLPRSNVSQTFPTYSVTVSVRNGLGINALLGGWIDWNGNGLFDASEGVISSSIVSNTATNQNVTLTWTNQTLLNPGNIGGTYARFRLTREDDGLTTADARGIKSYGEVEDYYIAFTVLPPVAQNRIADPMNNSQAETVLPALIAADPQGSTITGYTIATLPAAASGVLYYCDPACVAVTAAQTITDPTKLKFDPAASFVGDASFTYTATSENGVSNVATVGIPVYNLPPLAQSYMTSRINSSPTPVAAQLPMLPANDADGTLSSYKITSLPTSGTLQLCSNATNPCTGTLTNVALNQVLTPAEAARLHYKPNANIVAYTLDNFRFTTTDNNNNVSNEGNVYLPIQPAGVTTLPNLPPIAQNTEIAPVRNTAGSTKLPTLPATDPDGTVTNFTILSLPTSGTLNLCSNGTNPCTGTLTAVALNQTITAAQAAQLFYTPDPNNAGGTFNFNYRAIDNSSLTSNTATMILPVYNPAPEVINELSFLMKSGTVNGPVIAPIGTDNGSVTSYTITTLPNTVTQGTLNYCVTPPSTGCGTAVPANVALTPAQIATLTFTPASGFSGNVPFNYTATDNNGKVSSPATITIPVVDNAVGQPPVAFNYNYPTVINSNSGVAVPLSLTSTDPDGTVVTYKVLNLPPTSQGTLQYCATGSLPGCTLITLPANTPLTATQKATVSWLPNASYSGPVDFSFSTIDNSGLPSNIANVHLNQVNKAPTANSSITNPTTAGGSPVATPLTSSDPDGTVSTYVVNSVPPTSQGVLSYCVTPPSTGCGTAVTPGIVLTPAQAATVSFTPASSVKVSNVTFGFSVYDNAGLISNEATVIIPVTNITALPVTLIRFDASATKECTALLQWQTGTEKAMKEYVVEVSADGSRFVTLATVKSSNSATGSVYTEKVAMPYAVNQYRIMMVENDGSFNYTGVRTVLASDCKQNGVRLFPNPVTSDVQVTGLTSAARVDIYDMTGRVIYSRSNVANNERINMTSFASGLYTVKLTDAAQQVTVVQIEKK